MTGFKFRILKGILLEEIAKQGQGRGFLLRLKAILLENQFYSGVLESMFLKLYRDLSRPTHP